MDFAVYGASIDLFLCNILCLHFFVFKYRNILFCFAIRVFLIVLFLLYCLYVACMLLLHCICVALALHVIYLTM